jgi:hypothetical protein
MATSEHRERAAGLAGYSILCVAYEVLLVLLVRWPFRVM